MKNYAGSRLNPWLGHLMVSRSETPRALLTPGEVMQLPPADEIVMVAGSPPIRAKKARYFEDQRLSERILLPPDPQSCQKSLRQDAWTSLPPVQPDPVLAADAAKTEQDNANGGRNYPPPASGDQAEMAPSMVWKGLHPDRRAVSTVVRMAASASTAHLAR